MAARLGLSRQWIQLTKIPHYDICQSKRRQAVRLGAIEVDRRRVSDIIRQWRVAQLQSIRSSL